MLNLKDYRVNQQIHFWLREPSDYELVEPSIGRAKVCHTYHETKDFVEDPSRDVVHTTQIAFLMENLLEHGISVWIHPCEGAAFQIKLGDENIRTEREIRSSHNLLRMLWGGEFGNVLTYYQ